MTPPPYSSKMGLKISTFSKFFYEEEKGKDLWDKSRNTIFSVIMTLFGAILLIGAFYLFYHEISEHPLVTENLAHPHVSKGTLGRGALRARLCPLRLNCQENEQPVRMSERVSEWVMDEQKVTSTQFADNYRTNGEAANGSIGLPLI